MEHRKGLFNARNASGRDPNLAWKGRKSVQGGALFGTSGAWCSDAYTLWRFCTQMTTTGLRLRTVSRNNVRNRRPAARLKLHLGLYLFPAACSSTAEGTFMGVFVTSRVLEAFSTSPDIKHSRLPGGEQHARNRQMAQEAQTWSRHGCQSRLQFLHLSALHGNSAVK